MVSKNNVAALSIAGVAVVVMGGAAVCWCLSNGHTFLAFVAAAATLGAMVPLYPPEEKPDEYV